ncbi:MAG: ABC transporter ATP-binding protein [Pseudomonadota bacterium]
MLLETKHLIKNFEALTVLDDLSFGVSEGQLTSIIGPNGAGKTTLFNVITGRFPPTSGSILFQGREIGGLKPHLSSRLGLARSFQISNIFNRLTVRENVRLACQSRLNKKTSIFTPARRLSETIEKADGILERVGLFSKRETLAGELSHGEQRHLEIAMTLGTDPVLLLLDEPTSGMSPAETLETMELIKEISKTVTILLIEHDMQLVMNISQKVIVLDYGVKIAEGSPEEIAADPEVRKVYLGGL